MNARSRAKYVALSLSLCAVPALAATLNVCVKDPSGAAIPGAVISLDGRGTPSRSSSPVDAQGCAHFDSLFAHGYEISVANLYYRFSSPNLSLNWRSTAVAAQNYDATVSRQRGGYAVEDMFASWYPGGFEKVRFDLRAGNIFDKRYSIYKAASSYPYVPEMGRDVRLSVSARF